MPTDILSLCCSLTPTRPQGWPLNRTQCTSKLQFTFHIWKLSPSYTVYNEFIKDLPCIRNQRNPGLLCHLWIRLWIQVEHLGVVRRSLCLPVALCLHEAPWSLDRGNHLFLGCASEGCRMSQRSFVSLQPRLAYDPWDTDINKDTDLFIFFLKSHENKFTRHKARHHRLTWNFFKSKIH